MNKQELIDKQIAAGKFYTSAIKDMMFSKMITWYPYVDEGQVWFHIVETNDEMCGDKVGDWSWCDKFVFAVSVNGEWVDESYFERLENLKAFL